MSGQASQIASNVAIVASYLPAAVLREVYSGGPSTVIASALLPKGAAIPVPRGFRLTGRWPFANGCHQADWTLERLRGPERGRGRGPDVQRCRDDRNLHEQPPRTLLPRRARRRCSLYQDIPPPDVRHSIPICSAKVRISGTSKSGCACAGGVAPKPGFAWRRLIQTVDRPSVLAGAMSW